MQLLTFQNYPICFHSSSLFVRKKKQQQQQQFGRIISSNSVCEPITQSTLIDSAIKQIEKQKKKQKNEKWLNLKF
jgi:hypothetical protein